MSIILASAARFSDRESASLGMLAVRTSELALRSPPDGCADRLRANDCNRCGARALSVCGSVADSDLARLGALAEVVTLTPGAVLTREGDAAPYVFNITSGSLRVYKLLPDGRRQITGFLFAGDFLGLAIGEHYVFSADAIEPTTVCRFRKGPFRALVESSPPLEHMLLQRTSHELAAAQNQMLLLGRKTAVERLASFLMDLSDRDRRAGGAGRIIQLPMTRAEIADYLGLTTETVSRVTSRLKLRGVIRLLTLHSLSIEKPAELAALAGLDAADLPADRNHQRIQGHVRAQGAVVDPGIGVEEHLLDVNVDRPRTAHRNIRTGLQRVAEAVLELDLEAVLVFAVVEQHVVQASADVGAEPGRGQRMVLHRQDGRQDPGLVDRGGGGGRRGRNRVLGRAEDQFDGDLVRDEVGNPEARDRVVVDLDVEAGINAAGREDRAGFVRSHRGGAEIDQPGSGRLGLEVLGRGNAGGGVPSANRITLLRDANGDGVAESRTVLISGLNSPCGMALLNGYLYIGNTDALVRVPFTPGQTKITAKPELVIKLPGGGNHWARNVVADPD
eukprot:gene32232-43034_t